MKDVDEVKDNYIKQIDNIKCLSDNDIEYLRLRYPDSLSYKESYYRLINNIDIRPVCPVCGKPAKYIGKKYRVFLKTCGDYRCTIEISNKHRENTNLKLYGIKHYNNIEKVKQTCVQKYGVDNVRKSDAVKQKIKQVKLGKYGDCNYNNKDKAAETCIEKYGSKRATSDESVINKTKHTCIEKYGVEFPFQSDTVKDKIKQTCLKRYGTEYWTLTKQFYNAINWEDSVNKQHDSKRKNNTFSTSKPEEFCYEEFSKKYGEVIRQYKSELYPFNCDFYIPSIDLYIEYNGTWTHGSKPFENTEEDNIKLDKWKQKNTKYYNSAIKTWTIRDVNKRNTAKQNNLNYIEFWNLKEVKEWLKN